MTLLKITLITLLSTFIYAVEPAQGDYYPKKGEHKKESQKTQHIHYGKILQIENVKDYKYLKVNEKGKEIWVAIANVDVAIGDKIGYDKEIMMRDFKSKSLNQTFKEIFFASDVYIAQKKKPFIEKDTYTIEEIHMWREDLAGKVISIDATVYKVLQGIMELDWVHLGDGTGSAMKLTDDLVFTSKSTTVKTGDKVRAKGKVVIDKDFGFGYFYKVIVQDARFEVK